MFLQYSTPHGVDSILIKKKLQPGFKMLLINEYRGNEQ